MPAPISDISALLPIWVRGWALARGLPAPVATPEGAWRVDVGQPDQLVRYVIPDGKPELVTKLARELHAPTTWLKVCAAPDTVSPLLQPHWQLSDLRHFMRADLAETPALPVPPGFTLSLTEAGPMTRALLRTGSGQQAANGKVIMLGSHAVFDHIGTEAAFRRQGLGRVVMQALANRALARGAGEGLLVATEAGRQLYLGLDWHILSPYTSAFIPGMQTA